MNKLVLIDASSIFRPIFESTSDASQCHVKMVEKVRALASAHKHVAICCDSGRTFRHEIDATYKANREHTPAVYLHQCARALDTLRGDGFPVWDAKGFEADDVIATAAKLAETSTFTSIIGATVEIPPAQVLIFSADKDLHQIVSDRVEVFAPSNGAYESKTYDVAAVKEKHGVDPDQILDYLALLGDKSDNIIGAKGIGKVGAAKLLNQFGNIDDLYAAMDAGPVQIPPAAITSLMEFRPRLETVRGLLTLRTDVAIPFEEIFRERVPQDVAVFGDAEDDIAFAMPTLEASHEDSRSIEGRTGREQANGEGGIEKDDAARETGETRQGRRGDADSAQRGVEPTGRPSGAQQGSGQQAVVAGKATTVTFKEPASPTDFDKLMAMPMETDKALQFEARSIGELKQVAQILSDSRIFSQWGSPQAVFAIIQAGRELGMKTQQSLRAFDNIDNKPAMKADLIRALVLTSGKCEYFDIIERDDEHATFETLRKGRTKPITLTFTTKDGRRAWKKDERAWNASGWGTNPADMCVARAGAKLARLVYPDVTHGMYTREELEGGNGE